MGKILRYGLREALVNSSTRIILLIFSALILFSGVVVVLSYQQHIADAQNTELQKLRICTDMLSGTIDVAALEDVLAEYPDIDGVQSIGEVAAYDAIHDLLKNAEHSFDLGTDIYTLFQDDQGIFFGPSSGETPYFRHRWTHPHSEHFSKFEEGASIGPYEDEHGTWLSSFSPLRIGDRVIGIVQADRRFDNFLIEAKKEFYADLTLFAIIFAFGSIVILKLIDKILSKEDAVKKKIYEQSVELDKKNQDIMSSVRVAKRLQEATLPSICRMKKTFPGVSVLYRPKDIVSGDFYWYEKHESRHYIAVGDCTGHGIPGAFMAMMASTALYNAMNRVHGKIGDVLTELDDMVAQQMSRTSKNRDGMDIAICCYDEATGMLEFAGALRPLIKLRGEHLSLIKGDRKGIGYKSERHVYATRSVHVQPGDVIYIFSDGYSDQFGGAEGKKYMSRRFRDFIASIQEHPLEEQQYLLDYEFNLWRQENEQVDDVLVMGFEIPAPSYAMTA